ncbi:hypothetical protein AB8B22_01890 [Leptotrichia sp. HSP-334]|uniref:Uncharacterized protein n=1 Tax=Leptotrichia rugosa TaxID=3239302 RepID=A0AB39VIU0_9FUSO
MEIKLKSCFIEIRDNQKLKLFSSKRNKLDENNLYNKILDDIQKIDLIDEKNRKSLKNDEKKFYRKDNKLIGTVYYGKYGIEQSRIYNIRNKEQEEIYEIHENEAIQDRYLYFVNRFRDEKNSKEYIVFITEVRENKHPTEMFNNYLKKTYKLKMEAVTEKDVMDYFLKNSVTEIKCITNREKDMNNAWASFFGNNKIEIKPDVKKVELKMELNNDLKEIEKRNIISSYFRSKISDDEYISLNLKNGRKIKITNKKVEIDKYFYVEDVEKFYSKDGELLLEKIEKVLDDNFEYIKNILLGEKND